MSNHLPSISQFSQMTENDRAFTIQRFQSDIQEEYDGILSGHVMPWDGRTKASLIKANRTRLNRTKAAASYFGIEI